MKIIWQKKDMDSVPIPNFQFDEEERAIFIGALRRSKRGEVGNRMLHVMEEIDKVLSIMSQIESARKLGL